MNSIGFILLSVVSAGAFASNRVQLKSGSTATILASEETEVSCENANRNLAPPCIIVASKDYAGYWQVVLHSSRSSVDGRDYPSERDAKEALREHRLSGICH